MSLSEYLLYRDIQDLNKMAHVYQCECNRNSKLELVQSIHHKMLSRSFFPVLVQDLDPSFIAYSTYIVFQTTRIFSIEDLIAKGQYILSLYPSDLHPRAWISQLMTKGWLFPINTKNQIQLETPAEISKFLRHQWVQFWLEHTPNRINQLELKWIKRNEQTALVNDTHIFLRELQKSPFPLTIDGVIHKKILQTLISLFSVQEEHVTEDKWRFGYGRRFPNYPNRFALIYDYCYYKGWTKEDQHHLYLTAEGEKTLNSSSLDQILQDMRQYWLKLYKKPIVALPFLLTLVIELTKNQWISDLELFRVVSNWLKSYYYDDVNKIYEQRLIQMMIHLGYLQLAVDPTTNQRYVKSCN